MPDSETLESLVRHTTRSLRSLIGRSPALTAIPTPLASTAARQSRATNPNSNAFVGAPFLDDERQVRVLAKEIKRLIAEDARRGIKS